MQHNTSQTIAIGSSLIRLELVMSIDFSWNHEVNETSNLAYIVEVVFSNGFQKSYSCSRNEMYKVIMSLEDTEFIDKSSVIPSIDTFIEKLHKKYYDVKTYRKILKNNQSQENSYLDEDADDE